MRGEFLTNPTARRIEKMLVLCALLGSIWAGQRLMERFKHPAPTETVVAEPVPEAQDETEAVTLGEDVFRATVLTYLPDYADAWAATQRKLTARIPALMRRKLTLNMVYSMQPTLLYPITDFYDYDVLPLLPKPGTVVSLQGGPSCLQFVWTKLPMQGVTYTLEIAKRREFVFYRSFGADTNSVRVQVERGADFFWRVRAKVGRENMVSEPFAFLVLEPTLNAEDARTREIATRARDASAWLNDLAFCHTVRKAAFPMR